MPHSGQQQRQPWQSLDSGYEPRIIPPSLSGKYLMNSGIAGVNPNSSGSVQIGAANTLYCYPLWVPTPGQISAIVMYLTGTAGTSGSARVGIYSHDAAQGKPGTLLIDAGTYSVLNSTGTMTVAFSPIFVPRGWIWIAIVSNYAGSAPTWAGFCNASSRHVPLAFQFNSGASENGSYAGTKDSFTYAALPPVPPNGGTLDVNLGIPFTAIRFYYG